MAGRGGAGGAAGEQGSIHRNGVAAYLAVHGLAGRPIHGRAGAVPTRIHLEAEGPVDDIICGMQDTSTWYIQCKRTAGNDDALRSAVTQWVTQWVAQGLGPADRVVLASRRLKGILHDLQPWLDRQAAGHGAPIGQGKQKAIRVLGTSPRLVDTLILDA